MNDEPLAPTFLVGRLFLNFADETGLLGTFGEVERTGTSTKEMEKPFLSNSAVFPPFWWTEKRGETSKRPCFTKYGQEPESQQDSGFILS